jgi:hypothetical protein
MPTAFRLQPIARLRVVPSERERDAKGMTMLKWLMWLRGEREAAKHEAEAEPEAAKPAERRAAREALGEAKEQWKEDGDRADQDYYHTPGAGNPDRADPPVLDGKPLPKPKPKAKKRKAPAGP